MHLRDRAIEPYIEAIFWQEADKISQARKPIRLTRLQQALERRSTELSAYRDNPRLPVVLGERRFGDGVAIRARRVELAELELARARRAAGPPALAPVAELRQRWTSMSIPERRSAISEVIDCAFVMPTGDHAIEPRIHVLLRGRGPVGLPTMGEKCAAHPPFDPSAFPTRVRLRPSADWDLRRLQAELEAFTHGKERWPNFQEFQAAGRALLHAQAERHYGVQWWGRQLGIPFVARAPDRETWTDDKIRAGLSVVLAGRTHWPTWHEFNKAGHNRLRRAIAVTGGAARWATEFGVHLPKNARAIHRTWSYTCMKAEVARLAGPDKRYPSHARFRAAGLHGLCDVINRRGVRDQIAAELGLTAPNPRTQRHRHWTPEIIRAELDEFLRGREEWPRTPEFIAAGLGGLRQVMYRDGTTDYWMAQYGMTVRRNKQNR